MNPLYKYLGIAIVVLGALGGAYFKGHHDGYAPEHDKVVVLTASVNALGEAKKAESLAADKKAKEQANESEKNTADTINSIYAYYAAHPSVRMRDPNTCSGGLPKAASDSKVADDTAASGYFSPYSPELTELIANQLDQLQKLLVKDGVKVE